MQPENQQPGPSIPLPYQVPDYLHIDPVTGQAPKSHKKLKLILTVIVVVALLVVSLVAFLSWESTASERRFYGALDNLMQTRYLSRQYTEMKKNPAINASSTVVTDASDPANPKSDVTYTTAQSTDYPTPKSSEGEYRVFDNKQYFGSFSKASSNALPEGMQLNQWYRFPAKNIGVSKVEYNLDDLESLLMLNSVQGIVLFGNFNEADRTQLVDFAKANAVYSILGNTTQNDNGKQLTGYTIQLNADALNKLNQKAADLTGISQVHQLSTAQAKEGTLEFWIDNSTGKFTKMTYIEKEDSSITFEKSVSFGYPPKPSLAIPTDSKELP